MTITQSKKIGLLIIAFFLVHTACWALDKAKEQVDAGQEYIASMKKDYGEKSLGFKWKEITLKDNTLRKKITAFFGTKLFSVISYCDINMDGFQEVVAVKKYKSRDYQITKAIIVQRQQKT